MSRCCAQPQPGVDEARRPDSPGQEQPAGQDRGHQVRPKVREPAEAEDDVLQRGQRQPHQPRGHRDVAGIHLVLSKELYRGAEL